MATPPTGISHPDLIDTLYPDLIGTFLNISLPPAPPKAEHPETPPKAEHPENSAPSIHPASLRHLYWANATYVLPTVTPPSVISDPSKIQALANHLNLILSDFHPHMIDNHVIHSELRQ